MVDVTDIPGVSMIRETPAEGIALSSVTIDDELFTELSPGKAPLAV
jgi:hypothetical protein